VSGGVDRKFPVRALGALVVSSPKTQPNGAAWANETKFSLLYHREAGDPPVKLVKSDDTQTEWANTLDCHKISLH
jgi:hypothetical protein